MKSFNTNNEQAQKAPVGALSFAIALLFAAALQSSPAQAQTTQTFVSANGSDASNCARLTPCRTFQAAHDKTNAGGEINMLDPADYGPVKINKSISIVNEGVGSAGILVPSGNTAIEISVATTDIVNLRGLIIEGAGVGKTGIKFFQGKSLTVENCVVRNLTEIGLSLIPNSSSNFAVSNTFIADNNFGIVLGAFGSGMVKAAFNPVEIHNNGGDGFEVSGVNSKGSVMATVTDSVATNNGGYGFFATSSPAHAATSLMLVRSVAANNGVGFGAGDTNTTLWLTQSTVTGNKTSWSVANGASLRSYGDNNIDGNGDGDPPPTPIVKK